MIEDQEMQECWHCNGSGEEFWIDLLCEVCDGEGVVPRFIQHSNEPQQPKGEA